MPELRITSPAKFDPWDPTETVAKALRFHVDQGDVQTAVCALIVLNDDVRSELTNPNIPNHLQQTEMEQWMLAYIDLLSRFKLWSNATTVSPNTKQILVVC